MSDERSRPRAELVSPASLALDGGRRGASDPEVVNPAKWAYERLGRYIREFEADLDDEHEIGAMLVTHASGGTIRIDDLGYYGPDMISFFGVDGQGQSVQLIQHVSQLSVLLVAVKRAGPEPRRVGFKLGVPEGPETPSKEYG